MSAFSFGPAIFDRNREDDKHSYACWVPRPGGLCPDDCDCNCHITEIDRLTNQTHLYKVTFSGDVAESMMMALPFATIAPDERHSSLVGYFNIMDWEAVQLGQQDGFEVTRAREDWSI